VDRSVDRIVALKYKHIYSDTIAMRQARP